MHLHSYFRRARDRFRVLMAKLALVGIVKKLPQAPFFTFPHTHHNNVGIAKRQTLSTTVLD